MLKILTHYAQYYAHVKDFYLKIQYFSQTLCIMLAYYDNFGQQQLCNKMHI